jgi:hypothetical protein
MTGVLSNLKAKLKTTIHYLVVEERKIMPIVNPTYFFTTIEELLLAGKKE